MLIRIRILIIGLIFLNSSCISDCDEEVCICNAMGLQINYNFDTTTQKYFPASSITDFELMIYHNVLRDTLNKSKMSPNWFNENGAYQEFSIDIPGEVNIDELTPYDDYENLTYFIVNRDLNYIDSITNITVEHSSTISCNEQRGADFCTDAECKEFDYSSLSFQ
jgi:hypothetical protein